MKRTTLVAGGLVAGVLLLPVFQNCGGTGAPSKTTSAVKTSSIDNASISTASLNVGNSDVHKDTNSGLVEIAGTCTAGGGDITVGGDIAGSTKVPCSGGTFLLCTLLPKLGNNGVNLTQGASSKAVTVFEEHPVTNSIGLKFTGLQVTSATNANVTIMCTPGSSIQSTIYGVNQVNAESACPGMGTFSFQAVLVAGLANSGQRVVYVTQTTQAGNVSTIFADVDNVNQGHTCSITAGQANTDICLASAGSISGTCKGGSPVKVLVNDEVEQVVGCRENNTFSADNVVFTKTGTNKISIQQTTPFGTNCTAEKNVSAFSQI